MKRKIVSVVLCAAMAMTMAVGCGAKEEAPAAAEPVADGELIKVGIINNDPNESGYRTANDKDLKATFTEENGYEASFAYGLKNDEQITAGWDSVLQDAQDAGIRVILFDRTIDADESLYEASIVSDMDKEGETAVNWLKEQGLEEYNIIHLQGVMGSAAQQGRSGALDAAVVSDGWNLVTQQTAEWNAEKAQQIEAGETLAEKVIIMDEKGFDAATITQEDVDTYGI
ncbi:MAG: substrate-binding domain-containing protein [Clostridiales bacterium]|nr:substrate-binding domain-containing protein [Clostridiales bacterium]